MSEKITVEDRSVYLEHEILRTITRCIDEADLTVCEVVGVLEIIKDAHIRKLYGKEQQNE